MQMQIKITEHESILNTELQKANQSAQEKLEQIQADMEQELVKTLQERVKACDEECNKKISDMHTNLNQMNKQALDHQQQEHNWKLRELSQESQYKI